MSNISLVQHSQLISQKIIKTFQEVIDVKRGFGGFFPEETTPTRGVSIEVQRDDQLIAVDVQLFSDGNNNKITKSSEKIFIPPYFKEKTNFSQSQIYDQTFGTGISPNMAARQLMVKGAVSSMMKNRNKILRAIRKQQADVLQTGIVTVKNGDSVDYKRKAASMVVLTGGNLWSAGTSDPLTNLNTGAAFIRNEGQSSSNILNVVMGSEALSAFLANDTVKDQADSRRINRVDLVMPQFDGATGMAFHGQIAGGDYIYNIWSYNETYKDTSGGAIKYYLDPKNVVMIPDDFKGMTVFGAVPAKEKGGMPYAKEAKFYTREFDDERSMSKYFEVSSAPLVIPFTVDKLYSLTVL